MENLELTCFEIIANVGNARSLYIEAIGAAKSGDFKKAEELMEEGEFYYLKGHKVHSQLISQEADGDPVPVNLIILHAEDQLMSAEGFKIVAQEFIDVYKNVKL